MVRRRKIMGMQQNGDADTRIGSDKRSQSDRNVACAITIAARRITQLDRMHPAFEDHIARIYMDMQEHIRHGIKDPVLDQRRRGESNKTDWVLVLINCPFITTEILW